MNNIFPNFTPLDHAPFINNAVIPVNDNFQISVSYNINSGLWQVGEMDNYEAAIQVRKPTGKHNYWSLVEFEDNKNINIFPNCNRADLNKLVLKAQKLKYCCEIEILDEDNVWKHKFFCADGFDFEQKKKYCKWVWGNNKYRIVK